MVTYCWEWGVSAKFYTFVKLPYIFLKFFDEAYQYLTFVNRSLKFFLENISGLRGLYLLNCRQG